MFSLRSNSNKKWKWYVYILGLKNGLYYTAKYGVCKLVYLEEHNDLELARRREMQIKDFSRIKKRILINTFQGNFSHSLKE